MWAASTPKLDVGGAKKLLILLAIVSVVIRQAARRRGVERGGKRQLFYAVLYIGKYIIMEQSELQEFFVREGEQSA